MSTRRRAFALPTALLVAASLLVGLLAGAWLAGFAHAPSAPEEHSGHAAGSHSDRAASSTASPAKATVWTCSMHPQIQMPGPGKCPICGMDLIPVTQEAGADLDPSMFRMSESARKLAQIRTAPVERRAVTREVSMVGKVATDETRVETISARFPGRLDRLFVDYTGVPVKTGDHLASIYSPELLTAQQELLQAIQAAKDVHGTVRFLRETTEATIAASREKLRLWGLNAEQIQAMERSGKVSDHLTLYAHQSGIVIFKFQSEGDYVQEGSKIYTVADLSHLWVNLDAYESDLAWIRYGQEVLFETEAYPGETIEGRISFVHPMLDERTRTVKVRVDVDNQRGRLKPGMFVRGRVVAELVGTGKVYDRDLAGKWISPMHPEVVEDGPGKCRVCGMPLVPAETLGFVGVPTPRELPLVVPATAPLLTGRRALVYVEVPATEAPTYEGRIVTLGPRAGDFYLVKDGLHEGERVVVQGAFKIDSAVQIQAGPSMMTLPSEAAGGTQGLQGSAFQAALSRIVPHLASIAAAVASGDGDAASTRFAAALPVVDSLPLDGLVGPAKVLAEDLRGRMREATALGQEAWELPEQRRALLQLGGALEQALPTSLDPTPEETSLLAEVRTLALSLSAALARDDATEARSLVATSPLLESLRPSASSGGTLLALRWQLFLALQAFQEANEITEVRERFAILSDLLIVLTRRIPSIASDAKLLTCPMAFGGRGARWFQAEGPVANPYFGAAMLRCGEPYRPGTGGR